LTILARSFFHFVVSHSLLLNIISLLGKIARTFLLHLIHAVLKGLLVEAESLAWQLEPHADHMPHVHQALVQVAALHLHSDQFD